MEMKEWDQLQGEKSTFFRVDQEFYNLGKGARNAQGGQRSLAEG